MRTESYEEVLHKLKRKVSDEAFKYQDLHKKLEDVQKELMIKNLELSKIKEEVNKKYGEKENELFNREEILKDIENKLEVKKEIVYKDLEKFKLGLQAIDTLILDIKDYKKELSFKIDDTNISKEKYLELIKDNQEINTKLITLENQKERELKEVTKLKDEQKNIIEDYHSVAQILTTEREVVKDGLNEIHTEKENVNSLKNNLINFIEKNKKDFSDLKDNLDDYEFKLKSLIKNINISEGIKNA